MGQMLVKQWNRHWLLFGALCCAVLIWLVRSGLPTLVELRQVWIQERTREQKIEALQEENARLEKYIRQLKSDGTEVEKIARQELGWARPGEIVVKIPEKE